MLQLAKAIFLQLARGTLDLVEFGDNTITVQVIFDWKDEIALLRTLRPAVSPLGVKDVWRETDSTTVAYTFRLRITPSDEDKRVFETEIKRLFVKG